MKKFKVLDAKSIEVGTILIFSDDYNRIGLLLKAPYVSDLLDEKYPLTQSDDSIINHLLNKGLLVGCNAVQY